MQIHPMKETYFANMQLGGRNVALEDELRGSRDNVNLVPRQTQVTRHL